VGGAALLAALVYIVLTIIGGMLLGGAFRSQITEERMATIFEEDYELLTVVADYFSDLKHIESRISINTQPGMVFSNRWDMIAIQDENVVIAISELQSRNYSVIARNDNTIYFQRWSNRNSGRGIAFSIDGTNPVLTFLTRFEPLSTPNWFYYEEDFNEWRRRYQE